jgi:hypothetical protein
LAVIQESGRTNRSELNDHLQGARMNAHATPTERTAAPTGIDGLARSLRWARLTLSLVAEQALHLPPYAGSTFRGAFGHAFKRIACPFRQQCETCGHRDVCVYAYVFETTGSTDGSSVARGITVAHPFVLEPPTVAQAEVPPGGRLALGLTLIGRAIALAPYFLAACREMGKQGVGRGRGRFHLERVMADDPADAQGRVVYDGDRDLLAPAVPPWSWSVLDEGRETVERVTLDFLTPTRLRQDADLVVQPAFSTLATALLRRLSVLAEAHCSGPPLADAKAILAAVQEVRVVKSNLRWHDWERYSARQQARMSLGGFVGRVTFEGSLTPWWPLLRIGEVLHVGKGTAFGLGQYRLTCAAKER